MGPHCGLLNADECASAGVAFIHIGENQCCRSQRIFHTHKRRLEPSSEGDAASSVLVKHIYSEDLL